MNKEKWKIYMREYRKEHPQKKQMKTIDTIYLKEHPKIMNAILEKAKEEGFDYSLHLFSLMLLCRGLNINENIICKKR